MEGRKLPEFCPLCHSRGMKSRLRFYRVNFSEAVKSCENLKCPFPLGTPYKEIITYNLRDFYNSIDIKKELPYLAELETVLFKAYEKMNINTNEPSKNFLCNSIVPEENSLTTAGGNAVTGDLVELFDFENFNFNEESLSDFDHYLNSELESLLGNIIGQKGLGNSQVDGDLGEKTKCLSTDNVMQTAHSGIGNLSESDQSLSCGEIDSRLVAKLPQTEITSRPICERSELNQLVSDISKEKVYFDILWNEHKELLSEDPLKNIIDGIFTKESVLNKSEESIAIPVLDTAQTINEVVIKNIDMINNSERNGRKISNDVQSLPESEDNVIIPVLDTAKSINEVEMKNKNVTNVLEIGETDHTDHEHFSPEVITIISSASQTTDDDDDDEMEEAEVSIVPERNLAKMKDKGNENFIKEIDESVSQSSQLNSSEVVHTSDSIVEVTKYDTKRNCYTDHIYWMKNEGTYSHEVENQVPVTSDMNSEYELSLGTNNDIDDIDDVNIRMCELSIGENITVTTSEIEGKLSAVDDVKEAEIEQLTAEAVNVNAESRVVFFGNKDHNLSEVSFIINSADAASDIAVAENVTVMEVTNDDDDDDVAVIENEELENSLDLEMTSPIENTFAKKESNVKALQVVSLANSLRSVPNSTRQFFPKRKARRKSSLFAKSDYVMNESEMRKGRNRTSFRSETKDFFTDASINKDDLKFDFLQFVPVAQAEDHSYLSYNRTSTTSRVVKDMRMSKRRDNCDVRLITEQRIVKIDDLSKNMILNRSKASQNKISLLSSAGSVRSNSPNYTTITKTIKDTALINNKTKNSITKTSADQYTVNIGAENNLIVVKCAEAPPNKNQMLPHVVSVTVLKPKAAQVVPRNERDCSIVQQSRHEHCFPTRTLYSQPLVEKTATGCGKKQTNPSIGMIPFRMDDTLQSKAVVKTRNVPVCKDLKSELEIAMVTNNKFAGFSFEGLVKPDQELHSVSRRKGQKRLKSKVRKKLAANQLCSDDKQSGIPGSEVKVTGNKNCESRLDKNVPEDDNLDWIKDLLM